MKYVGSKNRHAKYILPIILNGRTKEQWYVEPFVGGGNMIDKVVGNRLGNDSHEYIIELLKSVGDGWIPPHTITFEDYTDARLYKDRYKPALLGFIGFGCAYSGKWFGGYARGNDSKGNPRNYANESRNNLLKQASGLKGIVWKTGSYLDLYIPDRSIIYCDPPYNNTTKYRDSFDHNVFWEWVRVKTKEGHSVFVSEYEAPSDFVCLWEKEVNNSLTKQTGSKKGVEKLFVYNTHNL